MSDSFNTSPGFTHTLQDSVKYRKLFKYEEPEMSNEELTEQIKVLSERIKDIEIKMSGKSGVLYIPTKEEIIKITKEQLIKKYRGMKHE